MPTILIHTLKKATLLNNEPVIVHITQEYETEHHMDGSVDVLYLSQFKYVIQTDDTNKDILHIGTMTTTKRNQPITEADIDHLITGKTRVKTNLQFEELRRVQV